MIFYGYKLSQYQGIPVMLLWFICIVLIFWFITQYTAFGRYFYDVGGNMGNSYEMDAIASCFIGGVISVLFY